MWIRRMALAVLLLALSVGALSGAPGLGEAAGVAEAEAGAEETPEPEAAPGYVLVTMATRIGWLPLPGEGELSWPIMQVLPDGRATENIVHLTPEGVWMEEANCENHDCVDQGVVTFENREARILGNMIICLPNQVMLQLFTPEEALAMMGEAQQSGR